MASKKSNASSTGENTEHPKGRHPKSLQNLVTPWKPGQSGNPNGRARIPTDILVLRAASREAFQNSWNRISSMPITEMAKLSKSRDTLVLDLVIARAVTSGYC